MKRLCNCTMTGPRIDRHSESCPAIIGTGLALTAKERAALWAALRW